jgi:hypothetical protein
MSNFGLNTGLLDKKKNKSHFYSHLPMTWLISSILFFIISSVVAPVFWSQLDKVGKTTGLTTLHVILGISGIIVYILEPIIWQNTIYSAGEQNRRSLHSASEKKEKNWFSIIADLFISLLVVILIRLPAMVLMMFKPVLRAMILYVSLSFLNIGSGHLGENILFVIPVMADILLYYLDMIAPKWKFNPVNALVSLIKIKNRRAARNTGSVLLIIHTALIYALLLNVVFYDINHHPENLNLTSLALWWLILTVYSRMSFISDDIDVTEALRNTPKRILLINLLALVISFIGFIWPFYFG